MKKEFESTLRLKLAVCMADFFSSDILHEIFCSPGICHRILLARYISKVGISEEQLEAAYFIHEFGRAEYRSADKIRTAIWDINRIYQYEEQVYIRKDLQACIRKKASENKENESNCDIIKDLCCQIPEYLQYKEFYDELDKNMNNINTELKKETTHYKEYVAECLLKEGTFKSPAYRFLHFWVIMSSFLPNHISYPKLKFPEQEAVGALKQGLFQ